MSCFDDPAVAARPADDSAPEAAKPRLSRYEIVDSIFKASKNRTGGMTGRDLAAETGGSALDASRRMAELFNDGLMTRKEDRRRTRLTYRYRWRKQ